MEWASASISRHAGTTDAGRNTAAQNGAMAFKVVDQVKGHHGHSAQFIARDDIQGKIGRNIFFLRRSGCALLCGRGGAVRLALGVCGLGWLLRLLPIGGGGRGGTVRLTLGVRGLGRLLRFLPISGSGGGGAFRLALGVRGLGGLLGLLPIGGSGGGGAVRLTLGVRRLGRLLRFLPLSGGDRGGAVRLTLGVRGLGRLLWFLPIRRSGRGVSIRFLLGRATSRRLTSAVWSLCTALWPTARSRISGTRPSTCSSADT